MCPHLYLRMQMQCPCVQLKEFADLLEKIFIIDPAKRVTVSECLKHPFIRDLPP
jgi:serine/threonine protein kinase